MSKKIKVKPAPKLREISFEGNMPSSYEKKLREDLAKSAARRKK